ncbi:MAG TPA: cysteine/glutathione ABC transporter permease/ATP-binding protein CydD [Erwinia persicina]|uniref:ABC-type xenobiotic transporter n=1 Tax=Erwinia persicina TaxID=55211 RepID=A0A4U3FH33_9GAMM|nr:cysteine/glutathione ABC transporter permease/ATP-binding protein CydD [Erwinia persicina]MBD8107567.1 cysteine/glutathione ABC transporter permease/ATP-binding protein CydD [Erwinia persicina]MBD8166322.1 cysteine/glutathione ABC transporter permease/ATP-binding protein CydD [Erwinia persicina]MBD8210521.1 cysteine/glutathione ABC transporter permease/ATP-binding protein CydD [Erwinia persicina]MCQ4106744.1 cysteine/glutathione ABC transporter permease/ATP-binding protein CydD [Erwinia pers
MNKTRQQHLTRWLKSQSVHGHRWLRLSFMLGTLSALLILAQAWFLASLLQALLVEHQPRETLLTSFALLLACFAGRALLAWLREKVGFKTGQAIRQTLRSQVLDRLSDLGPAWIQGKPAGSWATLLLEQIEEMQDYYARYLPQMMLAGVIPLLVLILLFPVNWAASLILLATAPLIPLFMAMVGMGAADANRRNFQALARLSGQFLDRLRGLETLRLFHRAHAETETIAEASDQFRQRTMEVLRMAFLSSAVLEFFASISIALIAVYFGFSYLGVFDFGHYSGPVTLFAGFLVLILAPEFYQPLRDLGTYYHAKAQAIGAADALQTFLEESEAASVARGTLSPDLSRGFHLVAQDLVIITADGTPLAGPLNFTLRPGQRVALVGQSGAGKTSLMNVLLGYLPYRGSLRVNEVELRDIDLPHWQQQLAWVGQNPHLPANTLRQNILLSGNRDDARLQEVLTLAGVSEFLPGLPAGLDHETGDRSARLSVGQAQRVAVARALMKPCQLLLLDEPDASLDAQSEQHVNHALLQASHSQSTLLITHQLDRLDQWDEIWLMRDGEIVQTGSHEILANQPGPFADLMAQRGGSLE